MYQAPHSLVSFLGDAYGQQEEWQTGIRISGQVTPTPANLESLDAAFFTLISSSAIALPNGFRYIGVKWAPIGLDGKYPTAAESLTFLRTTPFASTGQGGYPQIALVLSLRTARPRGYASNGRMYVPSALRPEATTGRITDAQAGAAAQAAAAFIGSVNAIGMGTVQVMSAVGGGISANVTEVRVGRVMDTQRRRRNGIPEEYAAPAPVPS